MMTTIGHSTRSGRVIARMLLRGSRLNHLARPLRYLVANAPMPLGNAPGTRRERSRDSSSTLPHLVVNEGQRARVQVSPCPVTDTDTGHGDTNPTQANADGRGARPTPPPFCALSGAWRQLLGRITEILEVKNAG